MNDETQQQPETATGQGEASDLLSDVLCDQCGGYNYELIGCCSGHKCWCVGQPVDAKPCEKCNADGKKEPSLQAQKDWPFFFLTEAEWHRHLEEIRGT
jgi:hypothetical protein